MNASDADVGHSAEITYALADLPPPTKGRGQRRGQGQGRRQHGGETRAMRDGRLPGDGSDSVGCVEKFHIDSRVGMVTAKTPLDYEQRAVYRCRVLAVDAGEPPNTGLSDALTPATLLHCFMNALRCKCFCFFVVS